MAIVLVGGTMIVPQLIYRWIPFLNENTDRWLCVFNEYGLYYNNPLWRANAANSPQGRWENEQPFTSLSL